jgi:acyl-CoA thioester hydrolase
VEELLAGFPVVIEIPVAWGEMDAFQHVNNIVYFRYFESARIAYLERSGFLETMSQTRIGPILAETLCRFRRPLTYPDTLSVGTRVSEMGEDRLVVQHRVVSHKLGAVAAEGEGTLVAYDYQEKRRAAIPDEVRRRIQELESHATP